jgi:DNA-directed RNA polymerase specialized sigma24 family protein
MDALTERLESPSEHLLRELAPQVLGIVVRRFGDFAASEDAVQESLLAAATQWPREGLPENPRAWLTQVASRRMTDHIRSESARRRRENEVALEAVRTSAWPASTAAPAEDDTLVLPSGIDPGFGNCFDIAGSGRVDHRRDCPRIPGAGGDHGPADQPGQAKY